MSSARYKKGNEAVTSRLPPSKEERSFMTFLWNPKTKSVLGRTRSSWAKIGLFYIVFYSGLAAFFSIMMTVFYQTLNDEAPKYTGSEDSLLVNPGLGFRPRPNNLDDLNPAITYNPSDPSSFSSYVESINKFLEPYKSNSSDTVECLPGDEYRKEGGPVCSFDVDSLSTTCSLGDQWGYNTSSPCIFLKLNKMFHWKPQGPESFVGLPEDLKDHINNTSENPEETLKQNAWVWCESEDEIEMEQPSPGLPLSYFPYLKQDGYLAPLVPVRLHNLEAGQEVEVRCRVWASNVKHKINTRRTGEVRLFFTIKE